MAQLQPRLGQQTFEMWLAPLRVIARDDQAQAGTAAGLSLAAPNAFSRDWFLAHYQDLVLQVLRSLATPNFSLSVEVLDETTPLHAIDVAPPQDTTSLESGETDDNIKRSQVTPSAGLDAASTDARSTIGLATPSAEGGNLSSFASNSPRSDRDRQASREPTPVGGAVSPLAAAPAAHLRSASTPPIGLSARYHFETFITASSNELAASAAQAVAEAPGQRFNPLFIYGGVGLGKTHLLHAVGHAIYRRQPQLRIVLISAETFMNEFVTAVRHNQFETFRSRYRDQTDVLLVDDIQFIAGRDRTMDEFFHAFNALYEAGKQIMVTADRVPADMPGMEERLTSRLNWGLVADVQAPDLETRIAILTTKIEREGLAVPPAACEAIASQVRSNVRELEGALLRVTAHSMLRQVTITPQLVRQVLGETAATSATLSVESVQKAVAQHFNVRVSDLKGASRTRTVTQPRMIAMYLSRELTNASFPEIGQRFGGKDHTTVMHAYRKIDHLAQRDADLDRTLHSLRERLLPHAS